MERAGEAGAGSGGDVAGARLHRMLGYDVGGVRPGHSHGIGARAGGECGARPADMRFGWTVGARLVGARERARAVAAAPGGAATPGRTDSGPGHRPHYWGW